MMLGPLVAALLAAPPMLGPADHRASAGRNGDQARIRNIHGLVRLTLAGTLSLKDAKGEYLLVRLEARNNRDRPAQVRRQNLGLRLPNGTWLTPEGLADRPPLSGGPLRPTLELGTAVSLPRDRSSDVYATFRTGASGDQVDLLALYDGRPFFLRRPLLATPEALADDAVRFARERRFALARGLLAEAGALPVNRIRLGRRLVAAARKLRAADQPVMEDRVLRLALPVAPNPAFIQGRLAELRRQLKRTHAPEGYRPAARDWAYHQRRSERYRVVDR